MRARKSKLAATRGAARPGRPVILVPVDGSHASRRAAREAADLAARLGARLVALHVLTPFEELPSRGLQRPVTVERFEKHAARMAERFLATARRTAAARRVEVSCHVARDTSAAHGIIDAAKRHRCRFIVMGTHGRRGLRRVLLGSVTQRVLAGSRVPVLVTR